ncbi:MAG: hypothetical protein K2O00_01485 [Muribaculaceae bacterium]|nr:hypothetical protein [Muribaculaceae bacterium]
MLEIAGNDYPHIKADQQLDLACMKMYSGNIDTALTLISTAIAAADDVIKPHAYATAAEVYYKVGMLDSAQHYANLTKNFDDQGYNSRVYAILLSKGIIEKLPTDTITQYANKLIKATYRSIKKNGNQLILIQNTRYNYLVQQRERIKAENAKRKMLNWLIMAIIIILTASVLILLMQLKTKRQRLKLQEADENIKMLTAELSRFKSDIDDNEPDFFEKKMLLKEQLLSKLKILVDRKNNSREQKFLTNTPAYMLLREAMVQRRVIPEDNPLWDDLLSAILKISPLFLNNLEIIFDSALKPTDIHTAILIKFSVSPAIMADLLGRSKTAISSRRESFGTKIFGEKVRLSEVDALIRIL